MQLGNCLKDLSQFEAAEKVYLRALELRPVDPDIYLQLGHLMKLSGRLDQALEYYTQSAALDTTSLDARREIEQLQSVLKASLSRPPRVSPAVRDSEFEITERATPILSRYHHALSQRWH